MKECENAASVLSHVKSPFTLFLGAVSRGFLGLIVSYFHFLDSSLVLSQTILPHLMSTSEEGCHIS